MKRKKSEYTPSLAGAVMSDVVLRGARLEHADLRGVDLSGSDLTGAVLTHADLSGSDLSGSDLTGAVLTHADLSGSDLSGALLQDVDLQGACLEEVDLRGADLGRADLTGANLRDANFKRAVVKGARFHNALLRDNHLEEAKSLGDATGLPEVLARRPFLVKDLQNILGPLPPNTPIRLVSGLSGNHAPFTHEHPPRVVKVGPAGDQRSELAIETDIEWVVD